MNLKLAHLGDLMEMHFNIPYYQRGYRWEAKHVLDLLDDLFEFQHNAPAMKQFYCLQPLVVCQNRNLSDRDFIVFDVIDGQQRLTTLFILMGYLRMPAFELRYERAIAREEDSSVWENGKLSYETLQSLSDEDMAGNPDYFYMKQAMDCIKSWFEKKREKYPRIEDLMKDVLQNREYSNNERPFYETDKDQNESQADVRFIWYEDVPGNGGSIATFKRLNYGKTPLTASELIKALLFQCDVYTVDRRAEMKQIAFRMSTEWDSIEKALQDDFMWSMIFPQKYEKASRIDIVLSFVAMELKKKLTAEIQAFETDRDYDYLIFSKYIEQERQKGRPYDEVTKELWAYIQDTYAVFRSWFDDRVLYHLTGLYLTLLRQSSKEHLQTLHTLVTKFKNSNRQVYIDWLKKEKIGNLIRFDANKFEESEEPSFENLHYGKFSNEIGRILLAYNVDVTMKHGQDRAYFPFKFYQESQPSLEHIHPQHLHDEDIDFDTRCHWFKDKYAELSDEDLKDEELRAAVNGLRDVLYLSAEEESDKKSDAARKSLKEKEERYTANEYEYNKMLKVVDCHFDELADIDEKELHCISNLALVDNITNICLGNGLLHTKRAILQHRSDEYDCSKGKQGACVFMGTWKVFNKKYTPNATDLRFWTKEDRKNYLNDLKTIYNEYAQ